jgi:pimeloyl-ACP methyl ester carboxylesterase
MATLPIILLPSLHGTSDMMAPLAELAVSFARNPLARALRHLKGFVPIHPVFSPFVNAVMLGKFARAHPAIVQELRKTFTRVSAAVLRLRMAEALRVDKRPQLAAMSCPLLYLAGINDRLIRRQCLRAILAVRPDTQVRQFDAPHMLLETDTTEAASVIRRFCDELPG